MKSGFTVKEGLVAAKYVFSSLFCLQLLSA